MLTINRAHAFSPGSDLWILPASAAQSPIARRIDWYLNFQLSRARMRKPHEIPVSVKKILTENKMDELLQDPERNEDARPLAVMAIDRLPANMVVELPYAKSGEWILNAKAVWEGFSKPRVRVFLPSDLEPALLAKHWPASLSDEFSIVSL